MQVGEARRPPVAASMLPVVGILAVAAVIAIGSLAAGPLAVLPIFGILFFSLVMAHPEYGIALFLSTFLMSYPAVLQGTGFLTINNVLGGIFGILLTYKMYREGDWWFIRRPEIQLLGYLVVVYYLGNRLNGPDPFLLTLLGANMALAENLRTFFNRGAFTLFFINYIRTPGHLRMIYVLALAFMVYTSFTGVQGVIGGGGLKGYRAYTGAENLVAGEVGLIRSAGNPNRLAMFAILGIAGLWYLMQTVRVPALRWIIFPTIGTLSLAVFMTASRSGLLGLGVCAAAIVWDEGLDIRKMLSFVLGIGLLAVVAIQLVPQKSLERITNLPFTQGGETGEGAGSLENRSYTWGVGLNLFVKHPIIGIGMGNWALVRFIEDPGHSAGSPHSSYLLALVEGGALGIFGFLALIWRSWRNIRFAEPWVTMRDSPLADLKWVLKGVKASILVLVFFSMFADLWQLVILFWLLGTSIVFERIVLETFPEAAAAH